ncbi:NUDIX domain-containing protein [Luteococcus peritonei]|uniref:NUDIX domain-containing protein n=1 Tax=Luteococcus peritonei TaxID=88874 RepID=A0ABW4RZ56_9ACTN
MPTPDFILDLRRDIGHRLLWLPGTTAVVLRPGEAGEQVLCVRRSDDGSWTPICGIVEPGEDPHESAVREAMEEAGVEIEVERLVWMSPTGLITYGNGDQNDYLDHTFRARWVSGEAAVGDDESSEVGWFDLDQLPSPMSELQRRRIRVAAANPPHVLLGVAAAKAFLGED